MSNWKFAYLGLSNKLSFTLMAVFQLTVSFAILYTSIYLDNKLTKNIDNVLSYFNDRTIYSFRNNEDYYEDLFKEEEPRNYENFNRYLNSNANFVHISYRDGYLLLKDFDNSDKFVQTMSYSEQLEGTKYITAKTLYIDKEYSNYLPFIISQGREFVENDFSRNETEETPVILGPNYANIFNLGMSWEYFDNQMQVIKKIKVIGFLDKNQISVNTTLPMDSIKSLDNYVIFPQGKITKTLSNDKEIQKKYNNNYRLNLYNYIMNSMIIIKEPNSQAEIISEIEETARKVGFFDIRCLNAMSQLDKHKKLFKEQIQVTNTIFFIVISICSIGIVSNMLYSIMRRNNEFGIHILTGASFYDIIMRVILEVFIIIVISLLFSFAIVRVLINTGYIQFELHSSIKLIILALILGIVVAIFPAINLFKNQANKLLRRLQ